MVFPNSLSLMKLNFLIKGLSEHKIGLNTPITNISLPGYAFWFDETKSTHGGTGFFINEKYSYTKRSDLNILLDKNLESIIIETNLSKKRNFFCGCIYKHPMSIADFNSTYLTPFLEKLNKEDKLCFRMGEFNRPLNLVELRIHHNRILNTNILGDAIADSLTSKLLLFTPRLFKILA